MRLIHVVKPEELELSNKMKDLLLGTPEDGGIDFVAVSIRPGNEELPITLYNVHVGCREDRDPLAIYYLSERLLRGLVNENEQINIRVYRGCSRKK